MMDKIIERAGELSEELTELAARDELDEAGEARFDEIEVELGELAVKRERLEKKAAAEERAFALSQEPANVASGQTRKMHTPVERDAYDLSEMRAFGPGVHDEYRGRALEAIEKADKWELDDGNREKITNLIERKDDKDSTIAKLVLGTGSRDYKTGWAKTITGNGHMLNGDERASMERAMSLTDGSGGYAVPFPIDPSLIQLGDGSSNPIRQISRVESITTDSWQGIASDQLTASWDAQAAEVSDDTTTFTQPSITAYKAAAFVPFSIEIGQDYPGLASDIAMLMADGKDRLEATAFATGTGSAQPQGAVYGKIATTLVSATTDTFAIADVYTTSETLGERYQANASWLANRVILNEIRAFGTAVAHTYSGDLRDKLLNQILGAPAYESSAVDGSYGASDNYVLLYGDFKKGYVIADRVGSAMEAIPHLFHTTTNRPSGSRGAYFHWRVGAGVVNADAFELMNVT